MSFGNGRYAPRTWFPRIPPEAGIRPHAKYLHFRGLSTEAREPGPDPDISPVVCYTFGHGMPDNSASVEIPKRALFKASEVCELVKVQPYVLRSWETEFPTLGVAKAPGGPRVYRRTDVEQVMRIKHLLLVDGLTLAGARRRLEEEGTPVGADEPAIDALIGQNARERLTDVKRGLRSILDLLAGQGSEEFRLAAPQAPSSRVRTMPPNRAKPAGSKPAAARNGARRKRSA
jgi:DNA-binding transcriptional MerR regulator